MKRLLLVLFIVVALTFSLSACSEQETITETVTATDDSFTLDVPNNWQLTSLNEAAVLQRAVLKKEQYLIAFTEDIAHFEETFTDLDYANAIKDQMGGIVENAEISDISDSTVGNNLAAKSFTISGTVEGVKIKYLATIHKGSTKFYQVLNWSTISKYETAFPIFEEILKTFKPKA